MVNLPSAYNQSGGLETTLVYVTSEAPYLMPLLFFIAYIGITLLGYSIQSSKGGRSSIFMWMTIAGFILNLVSYVLYLYPGIIDLYTITTLLIAFIVSAALFFLTE